MSRIATLAASNTLLDLMSKVQDRLQDQQVQVTTEKAAQTYAGIAPKAGRLVSLETTRAAIGRSIDNNAIMQTRLEATDTAVEAMGGTMRDFRAVLLDLAANQPLDEAHIGAVQDWAFRALKDMESYLNTEVNGRFLFAGSRATSAPADLGLTTPTAFQARFDGQAVIYPPTRAAHVETRASLTPAVTGGLTIAGGDTIIAGTAGAFANLAVGTTIRLSGSGLGNDGEYTVVSTNGSDQISIAGTMTVGSATMTVANSINNGAEPAATLSAVNWYAGDTVAQSHQVDDGSLFCPRPRRHRSELRESHPGNGHDCPGRLWHRRGAGAEPGAGRPGDRPARLLTAACDGRARAIRPGGEREHRNRAHGDGLQSYRACGDERAAP